MDFLRTPANRDAYAHKQAQLSRQRQQLADKYIHAEARRAREKYEDVAHTTSQPAQEHEVTRAEKVNHTAEQEKPPVRFNLPKFQPETYTEKESDEGLEF